ncbi:transcription factor bHLH118-like [Lycium ferocissimum]|uniref:transcription factor bHLH118-like n=1 Tax=Lycium ferocissimum TaxID=112874 RepID=UPI002815C0CE|nr:transcription factor bHLH118-like [Lycium ferocissimum]
MFPLQQISDENELLFQIPSNPCQQGKIFQDLSLDDYASLGTSFHPLNVTKIKPKKKRLPTKRVLGRNNSDKNHENITAADPDDDFKLKKIMHRDMERQRRQGMAALHSSLRSLLPLQYVKGKRSVSDHMHEAVNYIKQLQENMNELERKRDKLKIVTGRVEDGSSDSSIVSQDCVTVSPCHGGVEILISGSCTKENIPLSRVIQELLKEGLDVVSCVSANVNQKSLHRIQSEVRDMKCINLNALQRKVIDVLNIDHF